MGLSAAPAVVVLGPGAEGVARRVAAALPGARLHGRAGRGVAAAVAFADLGLHLRALFQAGTPIVGVCAAGILIRALAPAIGDKRAEPPVVAVAVDGSAVVPLLGGHRGGNELARRIAAALGVDAAVTTAGDARFGVALDEPPPGWRLVNPDDVKPFVAKLLAGAKARLDGAASWLAESALPLADDGDLTLVATERAEPGDARRLVYHPPLLALGVGCERGVEAEALVVHARAALADAGLAEGAVAGVYSLDLKADEPAVHALAWALDVPARFFDTASLAAETPRLANPSAAVGRAVGVPGVAEAAALAAAGRDATLILPKRKGAGVTCAVARAPTAFDGAARGRPRGTLAVVGLGPGGGDWRTPEAETALADADEVVGYRGYLDLIDPPRDGCRHHGYDLGEEETRVRAAYCLAASGRRVALVTSGDAGIYAMAALVLECLDRDPPPAWRRVALRVLPGVSAMQAAAARIGAPLGHDFCAISLSDLLTPWAVIERRLEAAAAGDFVVALYNPVSKRRRRQIALARDILLARRPATTPVVLARNLGRAGEAVSVIDLAALGADAVDMLTLVLIGSSATRRVARGDGGVWVYTSRGYAAKGGGGG